MIVQDVVAELSRSCSGSAGPPKGKPRDSKFAPPRPASENDGTDAAQPPSESRRAAVLGRLAPPETAP